LQALEAAQRARKATDLEEKQKAVIQAATLSKAANVKQMADYVVNNKNDFQELKESTLPDEFKQAFLEKANLVNKSVNPVEIEKTNIGNRIKQASDFITQKEAELKARQEREERIAREAKEAAEREAAKIAANKRHQKAVNNSILDKLLELGINEEQSKAIIIAAAKGQLAALTIKY